MEATLKFNLPDESIEFKTAVHSADLATALWDYNQKLRGIVEYGGEGYDENIIDGIKKAREILWEIINEANISDIVNA